jgi:hypothetical protein
MSHVTASPQDLGHWSQCLHALISHLDARRYEALAQLFTPQGRWLRQGQWLQGREAIIHALQARPQGMRVFHTLSNILVIECSPEQAVVEAYMTAYRQVEGQRPELFSLNTVSTTFVRESTSWQIAEQQMVRQMEFSAP